MGRNLPDQPEALSGRFAGVSQGALILAGGSAFPVSPFAGGKKVFSDRIDVLETPTGKWRGGFHLDRPIAQGASVTLDDGLLCIGGADAERSYASVVRLRWDGTRVVQDKLPDLPSPCAFSGAARLGNAVYVAGGIASPTATEALHMFWRLDLSKKKATWETLPPWPGAGRLGAGVVAQDGAVYVVSGASLHADTTGKPARTYLTDSWRYQPKGGWSRIADTPGPTVAAPIFAAPDGRILLFGGDSGADAVRTAELGDKHPGFRRDLLTFDTRRGAEATWISQPNALSVGLVTTNAVWWNDSLVIPGGEDRPGHRSATLLRLSLPTREKTVTNAPETPIHTALFTAGQAGYNTFRIPSLLATRRGVLLAFAEGRHKSASDAGAIDIVYRRSTDGGKTWGPLQVLWADGDNTCGNPCPVIDEKTGAISLLLTHNLGQDHEKDIIAETSVGTRTIWLLRSEDDGATWTTPRDITTTTKRPDWGWYATGPGTGIQIRNGAHKGRLVIPCDHSERETRRWRSHVIYSDDGGKTWALGGMAPQDNTNECQMAEVADGKLILNMRSADKAHKNRSVCFSTDGGDHWTDFRYDDTLIEPICQASLVSLPSNGANTLLFANPASQTERRNLTLRLSRDGGKTWPITRSLYDGPAAYSCLATLPDGTLGCLYEHGKERPYEEISFAVFTPTWLQQEAL